VNPHQRVWAAQGDAWLARGRVFETSGGAVAELPGVRLMASGLDQPGRNGGDVHEPAVVDMDEVRAWFVERRVPWGLRVPAGQSWPHGTRLLRQRCMALAPDAFRRAELPAGTTVRPAVLADIETVAELDARAFGGRSADSKPWMAPTLGSAGFRVGIASLGGVPVATATTVATDEWGGPAVGVYGVAVLPEARRRGIASALSGWLLEQAFAEGAAFAHLNPDTEQAAGLYRRLGFVEMPGFDIYTGFSTSR
jgi:ribosomal protein S18 acetylase RimI-like enzyme